MQRFALNDLCCPSWLEAGACLGRLLLDTQTVEPLHAEQDENELIEGMLVCQHCAAAYPVVCGLPILVADAWRYLWDRYDAIVGLAAEARLPIGKTMDEWVRERNAGTEPAMPGESEYESLAMTHEYLAVHFDDFRNALPGDHPLLPIAREHYRSDFYSVAMGMIEPHLDPTMLGIDLGCSVGRGVYELAGHCKLVYGVELAFHSAFVARRVLRHFPARMNEYRLRLDGDISRQRSLPDRSRDNVEIVVASAESLPFASGSCGVTNNWNIIDRLPDPERMLAEQERVLRVGGILSLAAPYNWENRHTPRKGWIGGKGAVRTVDAIRERILQSSEILDEKAYIPWVFWIFERYFEFFFSHGLVSRKRV